MKTFILILKQIPFLTIFVRYIRQFFGISTKGLNVRFHKDRRETLINNYYLEHKCLRKLQIGSQNHPIEGWLNVDIDPKNNETAFLDATKTFPLKEESFDYVFSEHMIEHIDFNEGLNMLHECFRILKKGGKIRISTPNMEFLIALYNEHKTIEQLKYIEFSKRYFDKTVPLMDTTIINNFFRDWGHKFIHDEKTLRFMLEKSGFENIRVCDLNISEDENFCNLEKHGLEITSTFNKLESIVIEAQKPI